MSIDDCCLGGPGAVIQIDESLFRHKPKVKIDIIIGINILENGNIITVACKMN